METGRDVGGSRRDIEVESGATVKAIAVVEVGRMRDPVMDVVERSSCGPGRSKVLEARLGFRICSVWRQRRYDLI